MMPNQLAAGVVEQAGFCLAKNMNMISQKRVEKEAEVE